MSSFKDTDKVCEYLLCEYGKIEHIHRILKPLYQATIVLQRNDFTMSDFFATWSQLEHLMQKLAKKYHDNNLATSLLECMAKRKQTLIDNPTMTCALALDPRFCAELTGECKIKAINILLNLWRRVQSVFGEKEDLSGSSGSDMDISIQNTTILKRFNRDEQKCNKNPLSTNVFEMSDKISHFISQKHDMPDGTIFDFWAQHRDKFPELHYLALVVFAIGPTQVVVERAFSTLSHVFSIKRCQLNEHLLNDILIISLNEDLFHQINDEDCAEIVRIT